MVPLMIALITGMVFNASSASSLDFVVSESEPTYLTTLRWFEKLNGLTQKIFINPFGLLKLVSPFLYGFRNCIVGIVYINHQVTQISLLLFGSVQQLDSISVFLLYGLLQLRTKLLVSCLSGKKI